MHEAIVTYFTAEKRESLAFIVAGVVAIVTSMLLYRAESPFRGMIAPLVLVGLIQLGVGGSVYFRSDAQIAELSALCSKSPEVFQKQELPRMDQVMKNFTIYKYVEITLLAVGIVLTFVFRGRDFPYSAGIGLIIQAGLMLVFDLFAEHRGEIYIDMVKKLV